MAATQKKIRPNITEVDATIRMSDGTMYEIHADNIVKELDNILNIAGKDYRLYQKVDLTFSAKDLNFKVIKSETTEENK